MERSGNRFCMGLQPRRPDDPDGPLMCTGKPAVGDRKEGLTFASGRVICIATRQECPKE